MLALDQFANCWDDKYPQISRSWRHNWPNLNTRFNYPEDIRKAIYTTNAIESLNSVIRKAIKKRKLFPSDDSAKKVIYLAIQAVSKRWTMPIKNWKAALNRFMIQFEERLTDGYVDDPMQPPSRLQSSYEHAEYTPQRQRLAELGWHVGTIFTAAPWEELWDAENHHDRLRELPLERFLTEQEDGWVLQKARCVRGRMQAEIEERYGQMHLVRLFELVQT